MKICLINNLYEPFILGGAEKVTKTIARGLFKAGHEVFIITTKPRIINKRIILASALTNEFRIYRLTSLYYNLKKYPKFIRFLWHLWDMFNLINYIKIKRILKKEKCDAVITNNLMGVGFLTALALRELKIKQIHIAHDIQLIHPSGLLYWGQEKLINSLSARNYSGINSRLFGSPRVVIFPSRWLMNKYMEKIFFVKSKRIILPNPTELNPEPAILKNKNIFKFLYLGQVEKHKGIILLIRSFKKVSGRAEKEIELIIAGNGSQLNQAKMVAGQDKNIKFLGWQNEKEVYKLLKSCNALVMPTLCYENCPTVILEAFSSGLPVIAADFGGISELLDKNAGLLFKPAEQLDLASKMEWAINHQSDLVKMAEAGKAKADLINIDNYIKELEILIK
jgi:glycosyltransferase involved in cell wall biosynthesis